MRRGNNAAFARALQDLKHVAGLRARVAQVNAGFRLWGQLAIAVGVRSLGVCQTEGNPKVGDAPIGLRVIERVVHVGGLLVRVGPILLALLVVVAEATKDEFARPSSECAPLPLDRVLPRLIFA